jgi:hypothetical protein
VDVEKDDAPPSSTPHENLPSASVSIVSHEASEVICNPAVVEAVFTYPPEYKNGFTWYIVLLPICSDTGFLVSIPCKKPPTNPIIPIARI